MCMIGIFSNILQAQVLSITSGSGFNIKAGTVIGADGLDLTPSTDYSITSSLSQSTTLSNATTIAHINKSYKFSETVAAYSGSIKINYQDSELNGLTESNLNLIYNDGVTWTADISSVNNANENYEIATLIAKPINELSLGINNGTSTRILDSQCGTTLAAINSTITCYPLTNATAYKFKVVDNSTNTTRYYSSGTNSFNLIMLSGTLYDTSYSISVAATIGGVLKAYGSACTLSTPHIKIKDSQCGTTLSALDTTIYAATTVSGATGYRFEVTNQGNIYTYDSLTNSFNLSMLNIPILYGESYAIRVSVNKNTTWQPYGDSCVIYTSSSPVKIQDAQCGTTLAGLSSPIISTSGSYVDATGYRFEVTNGNNVYTYDSVRNSFNLTQLNVPAVQYGASYSIRVSIKLYGIWQPYGTSCTINTPLAPLTQLQASQCGITLASGNATVLFANSVSIAQKYRFEVSLGSNVYTYDTASSSVRSFKMTTIPGLRLVNGTTYAIRVAIMANGQWQPYGASCNVTTYGIASIVVKTAEEPVSFNVIASPNPFTENFTFRLTTAIEDNVTVLVYDMTGKLLDKREVSPSELSEFQVGNNFSSGVYNVIVSQGENVKTMRVVKR